MAILCNIFWGFLEFFKESEDAPPQNKLDDREEDQGCGYHGLYYSYFQLSTVFRGQIKLQGVLEAVAPPGARWCLTTLRSHEAQSCYTLTHSEPASGTQNPIKRGKKQIDNGSCFSFYLFSAFKELFWNYVVLMKRFHFRGTGRGCPEKMWMLHPCWRPGWMEFWATCSGGKCPCPLQSSGMRSSLRSLPAHAMILWLWEARTCTGMQNFLSRLLLQKRRFREWILSNI